MKEENKNKTISIVVGTASIATPTTITFPQPFNQAPSVMVSAGTVDVLVESISKNNFKIISNSGTVDTVWIAMG